MQRRAFVLGLGVLAGGAITGEALSTGLLTQRETSVTQVVEAGVPQPQSVLTVRFARSVDVVDPAGIDLRIPIVDPATGTEGTRRLDVLDATATGGTLRLVVDGPVSQGAVVSFAAGSVLVDGERTRAFEQRLDGALESPERATQWFKAYEPTNVDHFDPGVYRQSTPPREYEVDGDPTAVRRRLAAHLDRFVGRGRLSALEREGALDRFDSPTARALFVDETGSFDPELLAGVLANAGTVGRGIEAVIIDGENQFGHPYTVRRQPTVSGGCMEVRVDRGKPTILVDPQLGGEPFVVLAPLFAHEGFHQDLAVGLDEEVTATYLEALVWAEHVLADPTIARLGTRKTRVANTMLLAALNSGGRSFPEVGLSAAAHRQPVTNVTPGATEGVVDFVAAVESKYRRTPAAASPSAAYVRTVVGRVTDTTPPALAFDSDLIALLDRETRLFSPADVNRLLAALELRPSADATLPPASPPRADEADPDGVERSGVGVGPGRLAVCGTCQLATRG
jgi:hypothetical protein